MVEKKTLNSIICVQNLPFVCVCVFVFLTIQNALHYFTWESTRGGGCNKNPVRLISCTAGNFLITHRFNRWILLSFLAWIILPIKKIHLISILPALLLALIKSGDVIGNCGVSAKPERWNIEAITFVQNWIFSAFFLFLSTDLIGSESRGKNAWDDYRAVGWSMRIG